MPNFIYASINSSKLAFEIESKIKQEYEKGDYSIKANLFIDPLIEEIKISKNRIKLTDQKASHNSNGNCC